MEFNVGDFIAGWIGGICGVVVGHPLDTVKVRQQTLGASMTVAIGRTYRYEGVRGFYKGMLFPLLTIGPANGFMFGVYGNILNLLQHSKHTHNISYNDVTAIRNVYISGMVAGAVQMLLTCPSELIKTTMQTKTEGKGRWKKHRETVYDNSVDVFLAIIKERGITGLYRGWVPMFIRDVPTSGLYTLTYEILMFHMETIKIPKLVKQTIAGGTAGLASWIIVIPFDVVKSRIQADAPGSPVSKGMIHYFSSAYKKEGIRIFFKGTPAIILRTFPVNAAIFIGYEASLKQIQ